MMLFVLSFHKHGKINIGFYCSTLYTALKQMPTPITRIKLETASISAQSPKKRCNYDETQMAEAMKTLDLVSNQVPYSMVNRAIEEVVIPFALANRKSIIAYSPLERGLLTGKIKPGHIFAEGDHRAGLNHYRAENIAAINTFLERIQPIADAKGVRVGQLVLRWTIDKPGITIALAGARNANQAIQNARAVDVKLSVAEMAFINARLEELEMV